MKEIDKNVQLYIWATITTQFHLPDNNRVMLASSQQYETELPIPGKFNVKFSTKGLYVIYTVGYSMPLSHLPIMKIFTTVFDLGTTEKCSVVAKVC